MKDAKRTSATVDTATDWTYIPHEHEELLRMAEKRRKAQAGRPRQSGPLELRMVRGNDATA